MVGYVRNGQEEEWSGRNHLLVKVNKTRERVMEFRLKRTSLSGDKVLKEEYKYLGIHTDNRLNWRTKAEAVHKKRMSRFCFLRKLRSFTATK